MLESDERLLQLGIKEDLWGSMTCELRFEQEGDSLRELSEEHPRQRKHIVQRPFSLM